nr:TniQ family protein [Nocardia asiatica]
MATATEVDADTIVAMTLARYDNTALSLDRRKRGVVAKFPWGRSRGSRYCPHCLDEFQGRWQLQWRLGWAFACVKHRCLLVDNCPECLRPQKVRPLSGLIPPVLGTCTNAAEGATGQSPARCSADLHTASTVDLAEDHPALRAQRLIFDTIARDRGNFGAYAETTLPAKAVLADIRAIARRALDYARVEDLHTHLPDDLVTAYNLVRDRQQRQRHWPGLAAPVEAAAAAVGATVAVDILAAADVGAAVQSLRWLVEHGRRQGLPVNAMTATSWGKWTSPVLAAVQLAALAPYIQPSDLLRYWISRSGVPQYPNPEQGTAIPAHRVPTKLWMDWALRFTHPPCGFPQLRRALSAVLMVIGTRRTLGDASLIVGGKTRSAGVSRCLRILRDTPHWHDVCDALIRLADYLTDNGIPIDYQRRRRLDYTTLLPAAEWNEICRATAIPPGSEQHKLGLMRVLLFERISGSPAERSPHFRDNYWLQSEYSALPRELTPALATELDHAARRFRDLNGLEHEPVSWSPPLELLEGLQLPGNDPATVDVATLHRLIRDDRISFTAAAAQLGTTIDALRYVMEHQPAPETLTTAQRRARGVILAAAEQALPRHMFIELYRYQGLGLQEIAGRFSVSKSTITRLAQLYEIPLRRPGGRQRSKIPEDWLWCQYVTLGRTLPQVAAAAGMSTSAISRRAKKAGIPIRSPGGPSHAATAAVDGYEILRPAIDSVAGFHRLKILAATARYKTYESAAAAINSAATTCTSSSSKQKPTSAITSSTGSAARPRSGSLRTDAMLLSLCNRCSPHDPPELFPGRSPARTGCFRATTTRRSHALLGRGCSADIRIDSYCKTTTILRRPHNISPDRRQFAEGSRQPGCSNVCSKLWHR